MKTKLNLAMGLALTTAIAPHSANAAPGQILWTHDVGSRIVSSPALADDGTVYVATQTALCAVTNAGSVASNKWSFPAGISFSSPAVGADGTVYIGGDGNLYAVKPDGSLKWSFPAAGDNGSAGIAVDGTIYFQGVYYLYALAPSGMVKWKSAVPGTGRFTSPAAGPDGTVYVASWEASQLCAIGPDGTNKWVRGIGNAPGDSPALGADGTVFEASGLLCALAPDGSQLWCSTNGFEGASPSIGTDGTIYARGWEHALYALTPAGYVAWRLDRDLQRYAPPTTPAVDRAGVIYYCASNSLFALTAQGELLWTIYAGDSGPGIYLATTSPIIGPDGTIYAALGSTLYAIASGTNGPANSSWPMYRHDARHTGSLQKAALRAPQKRSDANFEFQLYPQQLGLTYTIEASTNLNTWTSLTSFVATTLPTDVVDLTATNFPARFYRAFSPP